MTADASPSESGYAELGALRMYDELHGEGGVPLLLLHGGLFDIDQQFGALIPALAEGRRVIAADFQGHGRTNDIDRPLRVADLTQDVLGLLDHLGLDTVDVFGFSVGGGVGIELAVRHPARVRKLIASSVAFDESGLRAQNSEGVRMTSAASGRRPSSRSATPT